MQIPQIIRILVLDDNVEFLDCLKQCLSASQCLITTASTVKEAREILEKENFDLIIADYNLSDCSSKVFISWLKLYRPEIVIWLMSGGLEPTEHGAQRFFTKLTILREIKETIDEFLHHKTRGG